MKGTVLEQESLPFLAVLLDFVVQMAQGRGCQQSSRPAGSRGLQRLSEVQRTISPVRDLPALQWTATTCSNPCKQHGPPLFSEQACTSENRPAHWIGAVLRGRVSSG